MVQEETKSIQPLEMAFSPFAVLLSIVVAGLAAYGTWQSAAVASDVVLLREDVTATNSRVDDLDPAVERSEIDEIADDLLAVSDGLAALIAGGVFNESAFDEFAQQISALSSSLSSIAGDVQNLIDNPVIVNDTLIVEAVEDSVAFQTFTVSVIYAELHTDGALTTYPQYLEEGGDACDSRCYYNKVFFQSGTATQDAFCYVSDEQGDCPWGWACNASAQCTKRYTAFNETGLGCDSECVHTDVVMEVGASDLEQFCQIIGEGSCGWGNVCNASGKCEPYTPKYRACGPSTPTDCAGISEGTSGPSVTIQTCMVIPGFVPNQAQYPGKTGWCADDYYSYSSPDRAALCPPESEFADYTYKTPLIRYPEAEPNQSFFRVESTHYYVSTTAYGPTTASSGGLCFGSIPCSLPTSSEVYDQVCAAYVGEV